MNLENWLQVKDKTDIATIAEDPTWDPRSYLIKYLPEILQNLTKVLDTFNTDKTSVFFSRMLVKYLI
jgi:hypothetical protein